MSRRIAIVGAGQSGSLLALALRRDGYAVTLATDRTADEIRTGPVLSSQCMFSSALAIESDLGLDHWSGEVPAIKRMAITTAGGDDQARPATSLVGRLDSPAASLDQRLKCARWLDDFAALGGTIILGEVGTAQLRELSGTHDLTIVASGKGPLREIFAPDTTRTIHQLPQRISTMVYVTGMRDDPAAELTMTAVSGVGECLTMPALSTAGPCHIILIEAVPGGPLEAEHAPASAAERLGYVRAALAAHFPDIASRARNVSLTDEHGTLHGAVVPTVRHPVGTLCTGRHVLGMGDVVVLNDPVTGQGSNNAVHSAHIYHQAILSRGDRPFDTTWMTRTFEKYWRGWAQWSVSWTNSVLAGIGGHVGEVFAEATRSISVADAVVSGFDDPRTVAGWWFNSDDAKRLLDTARCEAQSVHDRRELRRALGQYVTGVTVITAKSPDGRKIGLTANSFTSVSLDPPLVSFCPARSAPSLVDLSAARRFAVNILAADQHDLSRQFATPAEDKFAGVEHTEGIDGTPLLDRVVARFQCRTVQRVDAGDHVIFLGEIEEFTAPGGDPLVFHSGSYRLVATHPEYA